MSSYSADKQPEQSSRGSAEDDRAIEDPAMEDRVSPAITATERDELGDDGAPASAQQLMEIGRRLRVCGTQITERLGGVKVPGTDQITRRLLRRIAASVEAQEAHLYLMRLDDEGSGAVALKYRSAGHSHPSLGIVDRFQFRLFPSEIQEGLKRDRIVHLRESGSGGRLLDEVKTQLNCARYILCPLFVGGRLRGILGIAQGKSSPDLDSACFEMLKLNGTMLATHVLRLRAERYRRKLIKRWRRIADQACDFAFSVTEDLVIDDTAPFGSGDETPELNGLRLTDIVARTFHREVKSLIQAAVEESTVRTCDFQMAIGPDGPRWYMARIEPSAPGGSGDHIATLYLTDNSPDKELEEEVRELRDHLLRASRLSLLGQMSTEFSHQLKQPLQAILTYCNMLQRRFGRPESEDERAVDLLDKIEVSVLHSADIIQSIREFVKHRTLHREEIELEEIIEQAMLMVEPTARGWNADLVSPSEIPDTTVFVDSAQTVHVVVNLMVNALEACHEHTTGRPRVELFIRENPGSESVTLAVKDNGPGLPKDDPDVVFQKFYTGKTEGLGMGLAISRDVCESQDGGLSAKNNCNGVGCTFFVRLPLLCDSGCDTAELPALIVKDLPIE